MFSFFKNQPKGTGRKVSTGQIFAPSSGTLEYYSAPWWETQIKRGLDERKRFSFENRWEDIDRYYHHRWENPLQPNFNLVYMFGAALVPTMIFSSPTVVNTARRPDFIKWTSIFDGIDNWCFDEMEMEDAGARAVLYAYLYNIAPMQLGYDIPEDLDYKGKAELMFAPVKGSWDRTRKYNQPWIDVINPKHFVIAPGTKTTSNCRWAGKLITLPLRLLQELPGVNKKALVATSVPDRTMISSADQYLKDGMADEEYVSFYEIHDAEKRKVFWMDTTGNFIMGPVDDPMQMDGLPYNFLVFNKSPKSIWGTPDTIYIETQMLEGNECRRVGRAQRRAAIVKFLYDRDVLTQDDIDKFLNGDPALMLGVEMNGDKTIGDVIFGIQPHVQTEYLEYQKALLNDSELLIGFGPNQLGMFASGRRTKFEAETVEDRNALRTGARKLQLAKLFGDFAGKINQLVVKHWKAPILRKVVGVDASISWVKILPTELAESRAELVTSVNVESLTPTSSTEQKKEMIEVLSVLSKFPNLNPMPILQTLLSKFSWAEVSKILPQEQQEVDREQFMASQQQKLGDPQKLHAAIQNNLAGMQRMNVNKSQQRGGSNGNQGQSGNSSVGRQSGPTSNV